MGNLAVRRLASITTALAVVAAVLASGFGLVLPASAASTDGSVQQTLINQDRTAAALTPLAWSPCLAGIALQNAQRMAAAGAISHANGAQLDLGCLAGATQSGENVGDTSNGIDDVQLNAVFMASPPHKANILGPYNYVGTAWALDSRGYGYIAVEFLAAPAGGNAGAAAGVASWGSGRLDVFERGLDNALWHRWYDAGTWSAWESLGGVLSADPAAVSWSSGRIDVFVRGGDAALWHRWYGATGWSPWESLGGVLADGPTVAAWSVGRLDVFVRGTDAALWHRWYNTGWSAWESLGGTLSGAPTAISWAPGRIDLFAAGAGGALMHRWYASAWSGWESLSGVLMGAPTVASWVSGRLDVFVRGGDSAIWHRWYSGGWSGWESLGGAVAASPAAASWAVGRIDLFGRSNDGTLGHLWYTANTWSPWEFLQTP
jgi:hypothetical protein